MEAKKKPARSKAKPKRTTAKARTTVTTKTVARVKSASKKRTAKKTVQKKLVSKVRRPKKSLPPVLTEVNATAAMSPVSAVETPVFTAAPADTTYPAAVVETPQKNHVALSGSNRTKLWGAVAVTMVLIVLVWVYALPYNISIPADNSVQLSEANNTNISAIVSDIKNSWTNLTTQAETLNETTKNTNSLPAQPSDMVGNQANNTPVPSTDELDNLFSDIN